jgi:hypothetical protein
VKKSGRVGKSGLRSLNSNVLASIQQSQLSEDNDCESEEYFEETDDETI